MKSLSEVTRQVRAAGSTASDQAALEKVLKTLIDGVDNDRSPYGINGYPFVRPLAMQGDAILYVCPKTIQTKDGFSWVESPGVSAQVRTSAGWQDQAYAMEMTDMAAALAAYIGDGARWVDPDGSAKGLPLWYVARDDEALTGPYKLSDYLDRALLEQHTGEGDVLMQIDGAGVMRQSYIRTDGKLVAISRDELAKRADEPAPGL